MFYLGQGCTVYHWFLYSWAIIFSTKKGSLYVSGKLPTYPFLKPTFCPKWEVSVNVGLGDGYVGSFPEKSIIIPKKDLCPSQRLKIAMTERGLCGWEGKKEYYWSLGILMGNFNSKILFNIPWCQSHCPSVVFHKLLSKYP